MKLTPVTLATCFIVIIVSVSAVLLGRVSGGSLFYSVHQHEISYDHSLNTYASSDIFIMFHGTHHFKTVIPFIYGMETVNDPYAYTLSIHGNFDDFRSVEGYFLVDGQKKISLKLDLGKVTRKTDKGKVIFTFPWMMPVEMDSQQFQTLQCVVTWVGVKDGHEETFRREKHFGLLERKHFGIRLWDRMMSI